MQGLQGKKVIAIATGSLHCVCCTEEGRWRPSASWERPSLFCGPREHVTVHAAQRRTGLREACVQAGPSLAQEQGFRGGGERGQCVRDKAWGHMV